MAITANEQSVTSITREIVATHADIIALFATKGITVEDENQIFSLVLRKSLTAGDRDQYIGEISSDKKLVVQYIEVSTPTEL